MEFKILGIKIVVNAKDAEKGVDGLNNKLKTTGTNANNAGKEAKKAEGAFASLGNILKTLSIVGLVTQAFDFFKDTLKQNQKVVDAVSAVMGTLSAIINQFINIVISVTDEVGKQGDGFKALGKVVMGFITLALTPLKVAWYGIKLAIQEIRLAFEDSIFGDKDAKKIKELTDSITETKDALTEVAKDAGKAGSDIYNNFSEAVSSVSAVVSGVVDKASKINVKSIYEQNKALVKMRNNSELIESKIKELIQQYDKQAEVLRQVRDDDTKSIDERIKANDELGIVLKKQYDEMVNLANYRLHTAELALKQDETNIALQKAVGDAKAEVADQEARITGIISEQMMNRNALLREQQDIEKSLSQNKNELYFNEKKFNADLIKDDLLRLEAKKQIAKEEADVELKRLQDNIKQYKEGTTARANAEIEFRNKKQEIDQSLKQMDADIKQTFYDRETQRLDELSKNQQVSFDMRREALDAESLLIRNAFAKREISEKEYNDKVKKLSEDRIQVELAEKQAKADIQNAYLDIASGVADLAKQMFNKSKGVQIAGLIVEQAAAVGKIITNTQLANAKSLALSPATGGMPWVAINTAMGALSIGKAVASTIKGIRDIRSANASGGGAVSSSVPSIGTSAPVMPPVPQATLTSLDQQTINKMGSATTRAYVVESDITNSQERISKITRASRLS